MKKLMMAVAMILAMAIAVVKGKHSIASEEYCMKQVTFALQNIKIRLWQAVKISLN